MLAWARGVTPLLTAGRFWRLLSANRIGYEIWAVVVLRCSWTMLPEPRRSILFWGKSECRARIRW